MAFLQSARAHFWGLVVLLALIAPNYGIADGWSALKQPGTIGLLRHALAPGRAIP